MIMKAVTAYEKEVSKRKQSASHEARKQSQQAQRLLEAANEGEGVPMEEEKLHKDEEDKNETENL